MWLRKFLTVGIVVLLVSTTLLPKLNAAGDSDKTFIEYDKSWMPTQLDYVDADTTRYVIDDSFVEGGGASSVSSMTRNPLPSNPENFDSLYCASYFDDKCKSSDINFRSVLPVCDQTNSVDCIVSLKINHNGIEDEIQFKKYLDFQGPIDSQLLGMKSSGMEFVELRLIEDFAGVPSRDLPPGSRVSLWQSKNAPAESKSFYAVTVLMVGNARLGEKSFLTNFQISVSPVIEKPSDREFAPVAISIRHQDGRLGLGGNTGESSWASNCVYRLYSACYVRAEFPEKLSVSLKANLSSSVTGWLHGRIGKPQIEIKNIDARINEVTISGEPLEIPVEAEDFKSASLPKGISPLGDRSGSWWNLFADGDFRFTWFEKLLPFLDDKADAVTSAWSLRAVAPYELHPCLKSNTKLMGLVTTNSMMYSGNAPTFKDEFLSYRVAGLHKGPKDEIWRGTYDLVMRSESARCLYKFSTAPVSATIQVVNSGGENQVSTTALTEKNGWLRLGAYNFTFSSPTIKVKLTQKGQATSAAGSAAKVTTIKCVKGKQVKSITSAKPVCPKGFKKK